MPKKKTSDDLFDEEAIEQTMKDTLAALQVRRALPYDGIVGSLYESWPSHHHNEFDGTRNWILKKLSHAEALRFLNDCPKIYEPPYSGLPLPRAQQDAIRILYYYFEAMGLGEVDGLRYIAGENAVIGLLARRGHTKRKPNQDRRDIQQIGARYWENNPNAVPKDILVSQEFLTYVKGKKKYAIRTYLSWLQQVDPRLKKPGRRARTS
jgi:hypothetical protein